VSSKETLSILDDLKQIALKSASQQHFSFIFPPPPRQVFKSIFLVIIINFPSLGSAKRGGVANVKLLNQRCATFACHLCTDGATKQIS
jgi:hypothetical protein